MRVTKNHQPQINSVGALAHSQNEMKFDASNLASTYRRLWSAVFFMLAFVPMAHAQDATALKGRYATLSSQLANNQYQRPITVESSEKSGELQGDIYALIEQPYVVVGPALLSMDHWCDILILHLNVKSCRASTQQEGDTLSVNIGRKFDQPLTDAYLFEFLYKVVVSKPDYQEVTLIAEKGPLGTSHCRIVLEVVALDAKHSFLHLSYSYAYGMMARAAMQSYLATIGRNKVGFSIVGHKADGQPIYMSNMRGIVERNTMRYYLAIEAYLGALSVPEPQQLEKRLNDWYTGVQRYPRQLHELERSEYLNMKRKEMKRQQAMK